jgi:peroxiredoxin
MSRKASLLAVAIFLGVALFPSPMINAAPVAAHDNRTASSASLSTLIAVGTDGKPVDISHTPGWRVVYFWSAACPCVAACERYSLVPLAKKYQGKIAFFAVASDGWDLGQPRKTLLAQIAAHHLPYLVLLDTQHAIAKALHAQVTPQTFVLDPKGRIVFRGMPDDSRRFLFSNGPVKVRHTYLSVALAEALAGKPVTNSPLKEAGCVVAW